LTPNKKRASKGNKGVPHAKKGRRKKRRGRGGNPVA